jgi:porphobilinogen deaminase
VKTTSTMKIGTRGSQLALVQTRTVAALITARVGA